MIWKAISIILILLLLGGIGSAVYLYYNPITVIEKSNNYQNIYKSYKEDIDFELEKLRLVKKQQKNLSELYISGWIPDWDIPDGINSVFLRNKLFNSVSPVWFFLNPDGSLRTTSQTNGTNQLKFFKDYNIELIPSIQEFDNERLGNILKGEGNIDKLIGQIVDQIVKNDYAGIDLDFEAVNLEDKHLFFEFLEKLSSNLKKINRKLVFTALPKWSDYVNFEAFPHTTRVQDYKRISDLVDEFRIMSYEFSGPQSSMVGPIQPLEWQEQIIQYAIYKGVPREKIVLGVSTYSYDWSERKVLEKFDLTGRMVTNNSETDLELGTALFNKDIDKIKANYAFTEQFNEVWGEAILKYNFKGQNRIIVFPTDKSIELRKQLASEYGIKGIAYWRLGDEGDLKL